MSETLNKDNFKVIGSPSETSRRFKHSEKDVYEICKFGVGKDFLTLKSINLEELPPAFLQGHRAQALRPSSIAFPRCISMEVDQKWSSLDSKLVPFGMLMPSTAMLRCWPLHDVLKHLLAIGTVRGLTSKA